MNIFLPAPKFLVENEHELGSQMYSVALPKSLPSRRIEKTMQQSQTFELFALKSQMPDSPSESLEIDHSSWPNISEEYPEPRIVLQPRESRKFKIYFSPKSTHHFEEKYELGILNSDQRFFKIRANGSGAIPRVDMTPSRVFKKVHFFGCIKISKIRIK